MSTVDSTPEREPRWPDPAWVTYATGHRVTVRLDAGRRGPSGGPAFRDVVGHLEIATPRQWTIRTRDGARRSIDPASIVTATVVPDVPLRLGTASDVDIAGLELIAADGWQPLSRDRLGEWVLRASNGFTGRANSVLPLGHPGTDIDTALDAVRLWYADRSLTPMIQLPLPLLAELGEALTARGWDHHNRTHVMVCDLDQLRMAVSGPSRPAAPKIAVTIGVATTPDAAWLDAFRYRGQPLRPDVVPILTLNDHSIFVSVQSADGTAVAIGRGAITDRWLGITAVEVTESCRRQGLGRAVMAALADYASGHGVRHVYLQVADDNHRAITLYESLGFVRHHDYVYRRWSAG